DGSSVEFIDASGINVLLDAADAARRAGGHLRLSRPSPSFRRLLDLLELNNALPVDREADWEPESTGPC
ncbi:MAG: STAS domain-containing protein, partial [Acidimicrobiales bacterium]